MTDKYLHGIPKDSRIAKDPRFLKKDSLTETRIEQIKGLNELAAKRGQTLAQMALSWILKDNDITSVLIGASRPEQITENIEIIHNRTFSDEELRAIDALSK